MDALHKQEEEGEDDASWHIEFGAYMIEGTPGSNYKTVTFKIDCNIHVMIFTFSNFVWVSEFVLACPLKLYARKITYSGAIRIKINLHTSGEMEDVKQCID